MSTTGVPVAYGANTGSRSAQAMSSHCSVPAGNWTTRGYASLTDCQVAHMHGLDKLHGSRSLMSRPTVTRLFLWVCWKRANVLRRLFFLCYAYLN